MAGIAPGFRSSSLAPAQEKSDEGGMSKTRQLSPPRLRPAGVVYTPSTRELPLLADFARDLNARGWRVGGLTQQVFRGPEGYKSRIVGTEVDSGREINLADYKGDRTKNSDCGFDTSALAEATGAVRRAIAEKMDLIVIEKFSRREIEGSGLFDEILTAMAEQIPTLTLLSADALEDWNRFTGGLTDLLPADPEALWRWWGPHRMYRDLELGVSDAPARRVVVGFNWVLVEGPDGCGMAQTPDRGSAACSKVKGADGLTGTPLRELAALIHSLDDIEAAIGLAAINAHYNRFDLDAPAGNGLEAFGTGDEPVTVIGRFPHLAKRLGNITVIEQKPGEDDYPAWATPWVLSAAEKVIVTASTLVNRSLPGILAARTDAEVALVGPSTPLTPRLHSYGISILGGLVVEDVEGAVRAISEGGSVGAVKPYSRRVTLTAS